MRDAEVKLGHRERERLRRRERERSVSPPGCAQLLESCWAKVRGRPGRPRTSLGEAARERELETQSLTLHEERPYHPPVGRGGGADEPEGESLRSRIAKRYTQLALERGAERAKEREAEAAAEQLANRTPAEVIAAIEVPDDVAGAEQPPHVRAAIRIAGGDALLLLRKAFQQASQIAVLHNDKAEAGDGLSYREAAATTCLLLQAPQHMVNVLGAIQTFSRFLPAKEELRDVEDAPEDLSFGEFVVMFIFVKGLIDARRIDAFDVQGKPAPDNGSGVASKAGAPLLFPPQLPAGAVDDALRQQISEAAGGAAVHELDGAAAPDGSASAGTGEAKGADA